MSAIPLSSLNVMNQEGLRSRGLICGSAVGIACCEDALAWVDEALCMVIGSETASKKTFVSHLRMKNSGWKSCLVASTNPWDRSSPVNRIVISTFTPPTTARNFYTLVHALALFWNCAISYSDPSICFLSRLPVEL